MTLPATQHPQWRLALRRLLAALGAACLLLGLTFQPLAAHGEAGVAHLTNHPLGSNRLSVWTSPGLVRPGKLHVEVLLTTADGRIVSDCLVGIAVTPPELGGGSQSGLAVFVGSGDDARYESTFHLLRPGRYTVAVTVTTADGRRDAVTFSVTATALGPWISTGVYGLLFFTGAVGIWLAGLGLDLRRQRRNDRRGASALGRTKLGGSFGG